MKSEKIKKSAMYPTVDPQAPARLSDYLVGQNVDLQRRIHTVVIRAVSAGELNGLKLRDRIHLPHCNDRNRTVAKSDVAFAAADVPTVTALVRETIERYYKKSISRPKRRLSYEEFLTLSHSELSAHLAEQRAHDARMRSYRD